MSPELPAVSRIATLAGLEALRPEWLALWRRVPDATPFQSPAWLIPWWQVFGQGELMTLALRQSGRLVGIVPLYVLHEADCRKLLPLGAGISDYLDPLLESEAVARGMNAVLLELAAVADRFDRCDLEQQRASGPWLAADIPPGWLHSTHNGTPAPVLELTGASISGHRRNRLGYYWRRAEAMGDARIGIAEATGLARGLAELHRLHAARWRQRGEPGVLADCRVRAFHELAAPALDAEGILRLYLLEAGGRLAAVFHTMADSARCHVYLCGFDPELALLSPGKLVLGRIIDDAVAQGLSELHLLRGQEGYKYDWGAHDRPLLGLSLAPNRPTA